MKKSQRGKWSIFVIAAVCVGMIWFFSNLEHNAQQGVSREEDATEPAVVMKVLEDSSADNGFADDNDYEPQAAEKDTEAKEEETKKKSGGRLYYGGKDNGKGSSSGKSASGKTTSATTEFDPDDHDIDSYYEDYKDEFDSIDDAYDAFEDDEDAWDDY